MSFTHLITLFSLLSLSFIESVEINRKAIYSTGPSPLSSFLHKASKNKLAHALKRPTYATDSSQITLSSQQGPGLSVQEQTSASVGSGLSVSNYNSNNYNQPTNSQGSSFLPTYTQPPSTSSGSTGSSLISTYPMSSVYQPAYGNGGQSPEASSVTNSLTPPVDYSSNSIYAVDALPSGSNGMVSTYAASPATPSYGNAGQYAPSSSSTSQGAQYGQQGEDGHYSSSSQSSGGYYASGGSGITSQGSYQDPLATAGSNSYYATSGGGLTSQGTQYNQQGTGPYSDSTYYAQSDGTGGSGYNQQETLPYSDDMYLGAEANDEFPESSFADPLPPISSLPDYGGAYIPPGQMPEDFIMEESVNEGTYEENGMAEDENLSETESEEEIKPEATPAPAPAPAPATPSADNNPLTFLNLVGTDFQPGRLVNIFFGLFIMLFMIIIHGYSLWVLGIAYLPGTRSLNQWELQKDMVEDILSLLIDAIEYWETRA